MTTIINEQIQTINNSLDWIKQYRPEQYELRFFQLVEERRKLRKIILAEMEHPAIAAYGESQKGKSYVMSNLLQKDGASFIVKANGVKYNFIEQINPITTDVEATGVVTRFTSFLLNKDRYSKTYPVLVKTLSLSNLATIICDSYYNDFTDYEDYSDDDLKLKAEEIYKKYFNREEITNTPVSEDDILDIKAYLQKFISGKAQRVWKSIFFERVALVIKKIPIEELPMIFSILWHENSMLTKVFIKLMGALQKLSFAKEVYVPIEAVLHQGDNENTIMSVDCLKTLYNDSKKESRFFTQVYLKKADGVFDQIKDYDKSELSAICSEVVYLIDQEFLSCQFGYCFDQMPEETKQKLRSSKFEKDLLKGTDLLDFPGARNRENFKVNFLEKDSNKITTFRRGKVAFLFNNYCESKAINILLFCHNHAKVEFTKMYDVIADWINLYVGKTPEARKDIISKADGISPLFVIATMFNKDMEFRPHGPSNERSAIDGRWVARYDKILRNECFQAANVEWLDNWTAKGDFFRNCYLLRDYKYSSNLGGTSSQLYKGFSDEHPSEEEMLLNQEYYNEMRTSFIQSPIVARFFDNPITSWDVAATLNNDGALYLIEKLSAVASKMSAIRNAQFHQQVENSRAVVYNLMEGDYEPEGDEKILQKNIHIANSIVRELDFACNGDNYFFGHLIQTLQITGKETYNVVHKLLNSPELIGAVNDFVNYELIIQRCDDFKDCKNEDEKWGHFMKVYDFELKTAANDYLVNKGVDPALLFSSNIKKKTNSYVIAGEVYKIWKDKLLSSEILSILPEVLNFDNTVLTSLAKNVVATAEEILLVDRMAHQISEYVNVVNVHTVNASLVTDVLTHVVNSYVVDFGYSYRTEIEKNNCKAVADQYSLNLFKYVEKPCTSVLDEDQLTGLFINMTTNPQTVTPAFRLNYNLWIEFMFITFIAMGKRKNYDEKSNKELGMIISKLKNK